MKKENREKTIPVTDELDFGIWIMDSLQLLLKYKKMIAVVTIVCLLIGAAAGFLLIGPEYESKAVYMINIPDTIETPYGTFSFPSKNLSEYGSLEFKNDAFEITQKKLNNKYSLEQLESLVSVSIDNAASRLIITAKTTNPDDAYTIASTFEDSYMIAANNVLKSLAINTFISARNREIALNKKSLSDLQAEIAKAKQMLQTIPQFITKESALLNEEQAANYYADGTGKELKDLKGHLMVSQEVNPEYEYVQELLAQVYIDSNKANTQLDIAQQDEKNLSSQMAKLNQCITNGTDSSTVESGLNLQTVVLSVLDHASKDKNDISISPVMVMAIAFIVGLLIGFVIAFFQAFLDRYKSVKQQQD